MKTVKLSVIVPIYGVEEKIERCAISLFEQSLEEIEYVFVNDATCDNSMQVLLDVISRYPSRKHSVKIVHHEVNKGLPIARKTGLDNAAGEYIIHCDSDDWMDARMCEKLLHEAESSQCDMVFCDYITGPIGQRIVTHKPVSIKSNYDAVLDIVHSVGWQVWRFICKSDLYRDIVFLSDTNGEDLATTCQLVRRATKISYISEPLYNYIIYNNSSSHNSIPEKIPQSMSQKKNNTDIAILALQSFEQDTTNEQMLLKVYCRLWNKSKNKKIISQYWWMMYPDLKLCDVVFNKNIPWRIRFKYLILHLYYSL